MRIAHLLMAHKDAPQVERLIKALQHKGADFYLHVDKKSNQDEFLYLDKINNVIFTKTHNHIRWGGYSITKTVIECTKEIVRSGKKYDFINLISTQEYPIKPVETFIDFLAENKGACFLEYEDANSDWWKHAIHRINEYHLTDETFKGRYFIQKIINKILPKRKFPLPYNLYGGPRGTWWTISMECAEYLVTFMDNHPDLQNFCYFTWGSDEFLIPTIIMNSPFKSQVINNNLRFIDWSLGGSNPKILTEEDIEALKKTDRFIARKFDIKKDTKILDLLDEWNGKATIDV